MRGVGVAREHQASACLVFSGTFVYSSIIAMVHFHNKYLVLPRHLGLAQVILKKRILMLKISQSHRLF